MLFEFEGKSPAAGLETYISELANIIGDVRIGNNCYIGHGAILRGDYCKIEIADGTTVEEGVIIHAQPGELCYIGGKVTLGHGAVIHSKHIGDLVVIGMGAILSIRSEVQTRSIIAEGAVVKQNQVIPPEVVAAGNPAKIVRKISQRDKGRWSMGKQLYIDLAKRYLQNPMKSVSGQKIYSGKESIMIENGSHTTQTRVRYKDTDRMGVVYYGNYLTFFEVGRAEYMRALGYPYAELERKGSALAVIEASAKYLSNAGYDELITVKTSVTDIGRVRLRFDYEVFSEDKTLLVTGYTVHACVNNDRKPSRIPDELINAVKEQQNT